MENLLYAGASTVSARTPNDAVWKSWTIEHSSQSRIEPMEHMSRGMQQKVAIARALLTSPVLLLLDEPTTGLDPRSKKDVQRMVLSLREEHDATVVLTTHDMEEADQLCDRLALLDRGRVVAIDHLASKLKQVWRLAGRRLHAPDNRGSGGCGLR